MLRQALKVAAFVGAGFFASQSALADDEATCDPLEVERIIELAHIENVEVVRPSAGSFKVNIDIDPDLSTIEGKYLDHDRVLASAVEVTLAGESCTGIVDQVKVFQGEEAGWLPLRVAGETVFLPHYFRNKFPVEALNLGVKLILFQKAYCDITLKALIYRNTHPFLRPQPYPDPQC